MQTPSQATTIAGCRFSEKLYESNHSLVYRGYQARDDHPVVLKMLKEAYPSPEKMAWFRSEFELTHSLKLAGVVEAYSLEIDQHRPVMVLEDFGGDSLAHVLQTGPLSVDTFLPLAIQIADILGQVHQQHIIHKDINPSNIVLNPTTRQVKLIDFGTSAVLSRENTTLRNPDLLVGTLAYLSPEQTGRMNRALDYRTDYYSLGVTFYELLTKQRPFPAIEALELVHAHIAKHPVPPHEKDAAVPEPLSAIVLKLMAKDAEDRYQSAPGLKADLEECLRQWQATGRIDPFPLGRHDAPDRFQIPQKLYGREAEIDTLLAAFERVNEGAGALLLVTGYAGLGKSSLVQELYKPITRQHGFFIAGKFDQLQRSIPYAALTQAFRSLIRQLLTETAAGIAHWRDRLLAALGSNGQVVIDLIPDLELIVGPQPAVLDLSPAEAQNRLNLAFQQFVSVFARPDHPLVLFLDDLQWADLASLNLLHHLTTGAGHACLLVIGAYRDNEVSEAHPLTATLDEIRKAGCVVNHVALAPLDRSHVNRLIADTLRCSSERAEPLATLVVTKTNGNPFFVNEFLQSLYSESLLRFDAGKGLWQWDLAQIQAQEMTDNVVALMARKVQKLEDRAQRVLQRAACIGNRFDLNTLAVVHEKTPGKTAADLWAAMTAGLVVPLGEAYKLMELDVEGLTDAVTVEYRFAHDRIQQAVYALIPDEDKEAVHWQVGHLLLRHLPPDEREPRIFDIVNQLNLGRTHARRRDEQDELAALNLKAGRRAKAFAAYQPAFEYLNVGVALMGDDGWQRRYDLTRDVYVEAAEAAYLSGDFEQMERWTDIVLQRALTVLERVRVYEIKMLALGSQFKILDAAQTGLQALKLLGITFPEEPDQADVMLELQQTQQVLAGTSIEELIDLPDLEDPVKRTTIHLLHVIANMTYGALMGLSSLCIFRMVTLSAKHGYTPQTAHAYAAYALIQCGMMGDIPTGYAFGTLALRLVERFEDRALKPAIDYIFNSYIRHWKTHCRDALQPLLDAHYIGLETGQLFYASGCLTTYSYLSYCTGHTLAGLEEKMRGYRETILLIKQHHALVWLDLARQIVLNLLGQAEDPCRLIGASFDEATQLPLFLEANTRPVVGSIYLNKCILCYQFHAYEEAAEQASLAEAYLDTMAGTPLLPLFTFYDALARLAVLPGASDAEREEIHERVAAHQEKMKTWAEHAPMNYRHKYALVEAERARMLGDDSHARASYDEAIDLAREHGYVNEEALANERAAHYYLTQGRTRLAQHYLRDAHYAYQRWGARAKVEDLEARYPQFLDYAGHDPTQPTSTTRTGRHTSSTLDLESVLKAMQAISGEIVLDKLLTTLMKIVIENAGAQVGFLLLEQKGQWVIEAEGALDTTTVTVMQSLPLNDAPAGEPRLPETLINYVARTQESVVLDEAAQAKQFASDPYIVARQPRSVLCTPLINQGKLSGLLYLENNLTAGAFTPDRLKVLNLLSSQAAISIENASLYTRQVQLTRAASRFVPHEFLHFLNKENITELRLGDQVKQEMAILVSDIRAFTTLSETMTPQENFDFVNAYLERVSPVVRQHQGLIVKYVGDGMMAVFPQRVDDALEAAAEQMRRLASFNALRKRQGQFPIQVGIGIHTGNMMLGTVGEAERMQLDLLSDTVNLASRLEGLTKVYGAAIIISEETYDRVEAPDRFRVRFLGKAQVKGRQQTVSLFEVFDGNAEEVVERKLQARASFEEGLAHYYDKRFVEAQDLFQAALQDDPDDKAARLYLARATAFIAQGVPATWDGVEEPPSN